MRILLRYLSHKDRCNLALCSRALLKVFELHNGTSISLGDVVSHLDNKPFWTNDEGVKVIQRSLVKCCTVGDFLEPSQARLGIARYVYHSLRCFIQPNYI